MKRRLLRALRRAQVRETQPTSCHSYSVWLWRVKLVVATNVWAVDQQEMSECDKDWLEKNAYVVNVTEPMYECAGVPGRASLTPANST